MSWIEWIGYLALVFGLFAMGNKNIVKLRILHTFSALSYLGYGLLIEAYPIVVGGSLFVIIHIYHLLKIRKAQKTI